MASDLSCRRALLGRGGGAAAVRPRARALPKVREQLVGIGQYSQAVTLLTPAIGFLQQTGTPKRAAEAQALLVKARAGSDAEARVRDAQQALEENDYSRTNALIKQASDLYTAIPDAKPPLLLIQY